MKDFLRVWDMFKNGTASIKDVDDAVTELHKKQQREPGETKETPHWPGRYDPHGDNYFEITDDGEIYMREAEPDYVRKTGAHGARLNGVCCKTREEAEFVRKQREAYLELIDLIRELNEGWRPGWNNLREDKGWVPIYYHDGNVISFLSIYCQSLPDYFQAKSRKLWERAIELFGESKVKLALWGIEDE